MNNYKIYTYLSLIAITTVVVSIASMSMQSIQINSAPSGKTMICHDTGSEINKYVIVEPSAIGAHKKHSNDIIGVADLNQDGTIDGIDCSMYSIQTSTRSKTSSTSYSTSINTTTVTPQ